MKKMVNIYWKNYYNTTFKGNGRIKEVRHKEGNVRSPRVKYGSRNSLKRSLKSILKISIKDTKKIKGKFYQVSH